MLALLNDRLSPRRRVVHAGDVVYAAGERFDTLYVLTSGFFKMINLRRTAASRS
jgi:CRP/FNR family transcriptional regulator